MAGTSWSGWILIFSASGLVGAAAQAQTGTLPCRDRSTRSPSSLNPTIYYTAEIDVERSACSLRERQPVPGVEAVRLCPKDLARCRLEGSCRVRDEEGVERLINYHSAGRFMQADADRCPYGYGSRVKGKSICLVPFQTVAADPQYHKPGDVLYVPSLKGLRLPRGFGVHSGYVIVGDVGDGIKGPNRFDFFTGTLSDRHASNPFRACGFGDESQSIAFEKIEGPARLEVLRETGFPEYQTALDPSYGPPTRGRGRLGGR